LWRTQGRLERLLAARWLGSDPVGDGEADPEDGFLRVDGKDISAPSGIAPPPA
jgi:hypothetical protein